MQILLYYSIIPVVFNFSILDFIGILFKESILTIYITNKLHFFTDSDCDSTVYGYLRGRKMR